MSNDTTWRPQSDYEKALLSALGSLLVVLRPAIEAARMARVREEFDFPDFKVLKFEAPEEGDEVSTVIATLGTIDSDGEPILVAVGLRAGTLSYLEFERPDGVPFREWPPSGELRVLHA